jgi:hypothetical protein
MNTAPVDQAGAPAWLNRTGPRRILALDGGGVRGIVSLAFLERIELLLRERLGPDVVLADYFDLIGGTSTGSLIATGLSLGQTVTELIETYRTLAIAGFQGSRWHGGLLVAKFRTEPLLAQIRAKVGDETLGSPRLRTGLGIVAKRIDTGSVWVFHNNPAGPFFSPVEGQNWTANRDLPLARLLRASTAAPTFFAPEFIEVAHDVKGTFVDGGVSPHNNPALLMLMLATLRGYGFRWPMGADRMMLISIGTGEPVMTPDRMPGPHAPALSLATLALQSVMQDCSWLGQTLLQWMGESPAPWRIDGEIGDLADDRLTPAPLLHYQRYQMMLDERWLREIGATVLPGEIRQLELMDQPRGVPRLLDLARHAAAEQVKAEHLPGLFDPVRTER